MQEFISAATRLLPVSLCLLAGCGSGGSSAVPQVATGPHGGPTALLPEGRGYGEVVLEQAASGRGGGRKQQWHVAAYFYKPDLEGPLEPLPSKVGVELRIRGQSEPFRLTLTPAPDPRFKFKECRFASPAADYNIEQLAGNLKVALGGEEHALPFAGRP
jgi:hypothetical protein